MKKSLKIQILVVVAAILSVVLLGVFFLPARTEAFSIEDQIRSQLAHMNITDAIRDESRDETLVDEHFLCYASEEQQLRLYFEEETGILRWADSYLADQPRREIGVSPLDAEITEEERLEQSRYWAELFLGENALGELELKEGAERRVAFLEYYDGQPTGTSVTVIWENGVMTSTITYIGEIFERNAQGQVVPKNEGEMISQERAIELGLEHIAPYASGYELDMDTLEFSRTVFQGQWTYQIRVESVAVSGFYTSFTAVLDPWTGEAVEVRRSL